MWPRERRGLRALVRRAGAHPTDAAAHRHLQRKHQWGVWALCVRTFPLL